MKKFLALTLAAMMTVALAACGETTDNTDVTDTANTETAETETTNTETAETETTNSDVAPADETETSDLVSMTFDEYSAAAVDDAVVIEAFIQGKQGWWSDVNGGKATFYLQDDNGGYLAYNLACTEDEYNNELTLGTKVQISGFKAEWSGEVEVIDATWTVIDGDTCLYDATDVTALLGTEDLAKYMNMAVSFNGLTVVAANDEGAAFLYSWDGSGSHDSNSDLYFTVADAAGNNYSFTVESYLTGNDTDVYAAVEALEVGQVINAEGFLYWYNGANPHITSVTVQ